MNLFSYEFRKLLTAFICDLKNNKNKMKKSLKQNHYYYYQLYCLENHVHVFVVEF